MSRLVIAMIVAVAGMCAGLWAYPKLATKQLGPENYLGEAVEAIARPVVPTDVKAGCAWVNPGYDKWHGDTYSALILMAVPPAQAAVLVKQIAEKKHQGTVSISKRRITGQTEFFSSMASTFGNTVCYGTNPFFKGEQQAYLYEVDGYYIIDPLVCGNVSRIFRMDGQGPQEHIGSLIWPVLRDPNGYVSSVYGGGRVPEPSTCLLILTGVAVLTYSRTHHARQSNLS